MAKFRKKPVVIEAERWQGDNFTAIKRMADNGPTISVHRGVIYIETLEGTNFANPGDCIIKGVAGEFYPCKPDIFAATYEPVEERV